MVHVHIHSDTQSWYVVVLWLGASFLLIVDTWFLAYLWNEAVDIPDKSRVMILSTPQETVIALGDKKITPDMMFCLFPPTDVRLRFESNQIRQSLLKDVTIEERLKLRILQEHHGYGAHENLLRERHASRM